MLLPYLLTGTAITAAVATPFFMKWLAAGNVLFTEVHEGTVKTILRSGSFDHMVMSLKGYRLNDPRGPGYDSSKPAWEVLPVPAGKEKDFDRRGFLTRWLGLFYVGLPPFRTVHSYRFAWSELRQDEKTGEQKVWPRNERTDFIYAVSFPYILILVEAETKDRLPVTVTFQVSLRVVNPYKALFDSENYFQSVAGAAINAARNYVGSKEYSELVSEFKHMHDDSQDASALFAKPLRDLNDTCPGESKGLHELYGVIIERADPLQIDLAGDQKDEILRSTVKRYTADQEAYTIKVSGEATADAQLALKTAEAEGIRRVGTATGEAYTAKLDALAKHAGLAEVLIQAEAMTSPGEGTRIIWANNPFFRNSGMADILDGLGLKNLDQLKETLSHLAGNHEEAKENA